MRGQASGLLGQIGWTSYMRQRLKTLRGPTYARSTDKSMAQDTHLVHSCVKVKFMGPTIARCQCKWNTIMCMQKYDYNSQLSSILAADSLTEGGDDSETWWLVEGNWLWRSSLGLILYPYHRSGIWWVGYDQIEHHWWKLAAKQPNRLSALFNARMLQARPVVREKNSHQHTDKDFIYTAL